MALDLAALDMAGTNLRATDHMPDVFRERNPLNT